MTFLAASKSLILNYTNAAPLCGLMVKNNKKMHLMDSLSSLKALNRIQVCLDSILKNQYEVYATNM